MSTLQRLTGSKRKARRNLWFERLMAILASINYLLVLFDLTYIPLRDFWLQGRIQLLSFEVGPVDFPGIPIEVPLPPITQWYDPIKSIEPHRDTQQYLETVNELENQLIVTSLQSEEVEGLLADLRRQSEEMIDTNPFQIANKTGTLERIKNKMREHVPNEQDSAKEAFRQFWSQDYLAVSNPAEELRFFNEEIRPLMATNYYRPIGETGEFVDRFGLIDFPFFAIFFVEFLARTWFISRRRTGVSWLDAMLWRWYDIFLLIPIWRWLRIIPVTIRLDQAKLVDMTAIQEQARQGFVASIAEDMTEVVVVRTINQMQGSINRGEITNWLSQRNVRPYIDINEIDEVAALTSIVLQLTIERVLPEVRSDLEAVLRHNVEKILSQTTAYQRLQQVPGLGQLENQLTERLVTEFTQAIYDGLNGLLAEDPKGDELVQRLFNHLREAFGSEIQAKKTIEEIQSLLTALLEEVKINYVERLSEEDVEEILDQTRAIRQIAQQ